METKNKPPLMETKNLLSIIQAILYILKKHFSKTIPWFELQMLLKRSTKLANKAIENLILLDHQTISSALTCRPNNIHTTFISPTEYQFSCSNTPLFYHKRKNHRHGFKYKYKYKNHQLTVNKVTVSNVKKAFEAWSVYEMEPEKSPLTVLGFGEGRSVRQLRVTDSPFPVDDGEEGGGVQVDKKAEEFIKNFYEVLKKERRAAVEPPSPVCYRWWGLG